LERPILPGLGAIESQTFELARRLALKGHEIHVITCVDKPQFEKNDNLVYHKVHTQFSFSETNPYTFIENLTGLIQDTRKATFEVCRENDIETVHCVFAFSAIGVYLTISKLSSNYFFYELNPSPWLPEYKLHMPWLSSNSDKLRSIVGHYLDLNIRTFIFRQFSGVIAISNFVKNEIVKKIKMDPEKIRTVYFGIDTDKFNTTINGERVRSSFSLGSDPVILYVGRLTPRKGVEYLVKAAPNIIKEFPRAKFLLVGPESIYYDRSGKDKYSSYIRNLIRHFNLDKSFIIAGQHSDLEAFYAASNVFVFPTLYEGAAIVMGEAMASGKPIITTSSGSGPELVEHGKSGILIPPMNENKIAEAVMTLISDEKLAKRLGRNAREQCVKRFSWDVMTESMLKAYRF
jgi:glycosyltransferase involved in cell wall biosynthesis